MTTCVLLARAEKRNHTFVAEKRIDKFTEFEKYSILEFVDGIHINSTPCAKSTWKKKFRELTR